ncbi:hypothetical protein EH221_04790 [bacterium]|nr:MAG: hypothetical protein EH221_04790 [bacterium]
MKRIGYAIVIAHVLLSGAKWAEQEQRNNLDLRMILDQTAAYCEKLKTTALKFVCDETVTQTVFCKPLNTKFGFWRPILFLAPNPESFRYLYYLEQYGQVINENRTLIMKNNKKTFKEKARLNTRFHHQLVVFGPYVFNRERQAYYDYQIDPVQPEQDPHLIAIRVTTKNPGVMPFGSGTFWIDKRDFTIQRIELMQENVSGFEVVERIAKNLRAVPRFTIVQEYDLVKRGIRFPNRAWLQEMYLDESEMTKTVFSEIEVVYDNYQFFQVGTSVEVNGFGKKNNG